MTETRLSEEIARQLASFRRQIELLITIPCVRTRSTQMILAEIDTDMSLFPSAAHLASWAGMCPLIARSAA